MQCQNINQFLIFTIDERKQFFERNYCNQVFSDALGCAPQIEVALHNDASIHQGSLIGEYTMNEPQVNGRSQWVDLSNKNAIWFDEKISTWKIGHIIHVGTAMAGIMSMNKSLTCPQESNNNWLYYNRTEWIAATNSDIKIDSRNGNLSE